MSLVLPVEAIEDEELGACPAGVRLAGNDINSYLFIIYVTPDVLWIQAI